MTADAYVDRVRRVEGVRAAVSYSWCGVLLALAMGLLGGLLPALQAVRLKIIDALRKA